MHPADPYHQLLLFVFFPLWLLAGLLDWLCHRLSCIERSSGPRESALHLLMLAQISAAILLGLLFELEAVVLGAIALLLLAHLVTTHLDTRFSQSKRHISPFEQQVHGFMDVLPWAAFMIAAVQHRAEWLAPPTPAFTLREPMLDATGFALVLGPLLLALLLALEELWRGLRHSRQTASWLDERLKAPPPSWLDRHFE